MGANCGGLEDGRFVLGGVGRELVCTCVCVRDDVLAHACLSVCLGGLT